MPFYTTTDLANIYYEDSGGTGHPFIYLVGFGGHISLIEKTTRNRAYWSGKGYRYVSFDYRGCGASVLSPAVSIKRTAQDLEELMAYLDLNDAVIVGASLGVRVIMEYISQFGCSRLSYAALIDMSPKSTSDDSWPYGLIFRGKHITDRDALEMLEELNNDEMTFATDFGKGFFHTLPADPRLAKAGAAGFISLPTETKKNYMTSWLCGDYRDVLGKFSVPTLIVGSYPGSFFVTSVFEYMHEKIPNSKLVIFGDDHHPTGHEITALYTKQIRAELESFMNETQR